MKVTDWFQVITRGMRQLRVGALERCDHPNRVIEAALVQGWTLKMRAGETWLINHSVRIPKVRERD